MKYQTQNLLYLLFTSVLFQTAIANENAYFTKPTALLTSGTDDKQEECIGNIGSVYSSLQSKDCQLIEEETDEGSGYSLESCPGVGGFTLEVADSDQRMTVTIVGPDNQKHPLNFYQVVTPYFSHLGDKAEWRIKKCGAKNIPIALIVRVYANDQGDPYKTTSYLTVSKITPQAFCVTAKINPSSKQNIAARVAADRAADSPCLGHFE